jgi:N-acetylmuramoyl-L-alanine amidase
MATIAISAGHNQGTGAVAMNGEGEWIWNTVVIRYFEKLMKEAGHKVIVYHRDESLSYGKAMRKLAQQIKGNECDLALELHFNHASTARAKGYEFLHWWGSKRSEFLAQCLGFSFGGKFSTMTRRGQNKGARSVWYHRWNEAKAYSGRGGAYLFKTHCPAVICEPFFGSNYADCERVQSSPKKYAESLVEGVVNYLGGKV